MINTNKQDNIPSMQHFSFENQELMQFPTNSFYGTPEMEPTQTVGDKWNEGNTK